MRLPTSSRCPPGLRCTSASRCVDTYDDGRPHHVKVHYKLMGITDKELLEYHWGRDWVIWDAEETFQQHAQHVEYTLRPEAGKTRVRFDITMEMRAPIPEFLMKRAKKYVLDIATEGLRQHVLRSEALGARES